MDRQPLVGEEAEFTARVGAVVSIVDEVHVVDKISDCNLEKSGNNTG